MKAATAITLLYKKNNDQLFFDGFLSCDASSALNLVIHCTISSVDHSD
jgi:hypothetical protein